MPKPFENMTPEAADAIMRQIQERLPLHDYSITRAAADVFEVPIEPDTDVRILDREIWSHGFKLIANSFEG